MKTKKTMALALMALGLTGVLIGIAAGLIAAYMVGEEASTFRLTNIYLGGFVTGALFLTIGGSLWEDAAQEEVTRAAKLKG